MGRGEGKGEGLFSKAKETASQAAGAASAAANQAAGAVGQAASSAEAAATKVAGGERVAGAKAAAAGAAGAVTQVKASAEAKATAAADAARDQVSKAATEVEETVRAKGVAVASKGVDLACGKIAAMAKAAVVDPDMPKPVVRVAEAVIDGFMPEVKDMILEQATAAFRKKVDDSAKMTAPDPPCCPNFPAKFRAHVLYHMFPHDKTIWASIKDPWWWFYTQALGAFPLWGVTTVWWFVVLLCKWSESPVDEFQLVDFVVSFKASQFTTACIQAMVVGASLYVSCIPDCSSGAPGSEPKFRETVWLFFARFFLCWVALALLPWSAVKGGYHYEPVRGELASVTRKGGRVWYWMYYDLAIFAGCMALIYFIFTQDGADGLGGTNWVVNAQLFHVKVVYGMLSFPWVILKLPMMYSLILSLKPTKYNRRGETVRSATGKEMAAAREARKGKVSPE